MLDLHGAPTAAVLADVALDALTVWCYVDSGERCRCVCHPRLPETDLHDYGFACPCARTRGSPPRLAGMAQRHQSVLGIAAGPTDQVRGESR